VTDLPHAAEIRPIGTWRLDRQRLREAVARFAPDVEIVDLW